MDFHLIYIKEAHPQDGWQVPNNRAAGIIFNQPTTIAERVKVAETCSAKLDIKFPVLVDGLDNKVGAAYSGWPDRLYIVGADGRIVYKGGPGPRGFDVREMTAALEKHLAR